MERTHTRNPLFFNSLRACAAVVCGACLILGAGQVWALPDSSFEGGDGNLENGTLTDWEGLIGSDALLVGVDEPSGQSDGSLKGKEDDDVPDIVVGSIPKNKSDLLRFYVHHEKVDVAGVVKDFLHLAWVRANTLGTANMDFEFNQSRDLTANGSTPVRTVDDMLITFAFASGGSDVILGLSRWTESGPCEAAASAPCWGPMLPLAGIAEGAINGADAYDPIEGVTLAALTFGEASVNLTDAGIFDRDDCVSFGSAYVKSRSAASFTASLKDFIRPIDVSVSNCAIVTVTKDAIPDDAQEFGFDASPELGSASFSLDDDGDEDNGQTRTKMFMVRQEGRFMVRQEGRYTVTENPVEGWDLTEVVCTGGGTPQVDASGEITGTAILDLTIGESTSCTFTNTKRGRILVDQVTVPGGDPQPFDFRLSATVAPESVSQEFRLADPDPLHDSGRVRPGLYSVSQLYQGAEWDLTSASCDDGSPVDSIELEPGEVVTCTFVNTKRGGIVVDVRTEPAGHARSFELALIGGPSNLNLAFNLADETTPYFAGSLLPGAGYAVSQSPADGWFTSAAGCDDGSPVGNVDVAPGEIVTCTFVNTRMGRIVVDKTTDPAGDLAGFEFALSGGPSAASQVFSLADESVPHDSGFLLPGAGYTIEELATDEDWDLTAIDCVSANGNSTVAFGDTVADVELGIDDEVRCTFTNTKRGTIVIVKRVPTRSSVSVSTTTATRRTTRARGCSRAARVSLVSLLAPTPPRRRTRDRHGMQPDYAARMRAARAWAIPTSSSARRPSSSRPARRSPACLPTPRGARSSSRSSSSTNRYPVLPTILGRCCSSSPRVTVRRSGCPTGKRMKASICLEAARRAFPSSASAVGNPAARAVTPTAAPAPRAT